MGISPITNLIPLQISRAVQADLEPMPMERVENTARTGDETYSPSNRKPARGSEDDAPEDDISDEDDSGDEFPDESFDDPSAETSAESGNSSGNPSQSRPISFFADAIPINRALTTGSAPSAR